VETASGRRSPSEDLISELFEEMHQLRFMPDIVAGAEYVLNILGRVLPCEGVLVHVFDINTRQFIVVRAVGPTSQNALLHRTPDTFALFRETFRRARTLSFPNADREEAFHDGRWERLGVAPRTALCGAVQQGGRYLGVIELANPKGGEAFHDSEINAVDYICEQFADFVASRPIVLDDDAVIPRA
jgi:GAF domain-containing protein